MMEDTQTNSIESIDGPAENESGVPSAPVAPWVMRIFGRFTYPFLLVQSTTLLVLFLNKLYQDSAAVAAYYEERYYTYCAVSAASLFVPALVFLIYIVAAYVKDQEDPETKEVGTRLVRGLLLVPWQIKWRVDVLQFSADKVCEDRPPTPEELETLGRLETEANVLEFFGKFYAGFTQILLQLYIIIKALDEKLPYKALTGEIIVSAICLLPILGAIRRKDDGILTGSLSFIGWIFIMVSRSVAIALAARVIHIWMVLVCVVHGLLISIWVTSIAIGTYQNSSLNKKRSLSLYFLVFAVFGLPSLTFWPIMFELKAKKRPFIFLTILLLENLLFVLLWTWLRDEDAWHMHDSILLAVAVGLYVLGSLFIFLYILSKPKYTDDVVYEDIKGSSTNSFGMYFEFYDAAFKHTKNEVVGRRLKEMRQQQPARVCESASLSEPPETSSSFHRPGSRGGQAELPAPDDNLESILAPDDNLESNLESILAPDDNLKSNLVSNLSSDIKLESHLESFFHPDLRRELEIQEIQMLGRQVDILASVIENSRSGPDLSSKRKKRSKQ